MESAIKKAQVQALVGMSQIPTISGVSSSILVAIRDFVGDMKAGAAALSLAGLIALSSGVGVSNAYADEFPSGKDVATQVLGGVAGGTIGAVVTDKATEKKDKHGKKKDNTQAKSVGAAVGVIGGMGVASPDQGVGSNVGFNWGTAIGGIAGSVLGNQIGKGNGKVLATGVGAAIGAVVGSEMTKEQPVAQPTTQYGGGQVYQPAVGDATISTGLNYQQHNSLMSNLTGQKQGGRSLSDNPQAESAVYKSINQYQASCEAIQATQGELMAAQEMKKWAATSAEQAAANRRLSEASRNAERAQDGCAGAKSVSMRILSQADSEGFDLSGVGPAVIQIMHDEAKVRITYNANHGTQIYRSPNYSYQQQQSGQYDTNRQVRDVNRTANDTVSTVDGVMRTGKRIGNMF